jgi:ribonuclease BN (tRNA processing enzyme)
MTDSDQGWVAIWLQAYRTILTHFSQRYPKVPAGLGLDLPSTVAGVSGSIRTGGAGDVSNAMNAVSLAYDGMHVALAALPWLPQLTSQIAAVLQAGEGEQAVNDA